MLSHLLINLILFLLNLHLTCCRYEKKRRITPRHIQLAILSDEEINILTKGIIIPQGGVIPWTHPSLLPKKDKDKKTRQDCQGVFGYEFQSGGQPKFM